MQFKLKVYNELFNQYIKIFALVLLCIPVFMMFTSHILFASHTHIFWYVPEWFHLFILFDLFLVTKKV